MIYNLLILTKQILNLTRLFLFLMDLFRVLVLSLLNGTHGDWIWYVFLHYPIEFFKNDPQHKTANFVLAVSLENNPIKYVYNLEM